MQFVILIGFKLYNYYLYALIRQNYLCEKQNVQETQSRNTLYVKVAHPMFEHHR